jgi:hypothetical protein
MVGIVKLALARAYTLVVMPVVSIFIALAHKRPGWSRYRDSGVSLIFIACRLTT